MICCLRSVIKLRKGAITAVSCDILERYLSLWIAKSYFTCFSPIKTSAASVRVRFRLKHHLTRYFMKPSSLTFHQEGWRVSASISGEFISLYFEKKKVPNAGNWGSVCCPAKVVSASICPYWLATTIIRVIQRVPQVGTCGLKLNDGLKFECYLITE